MSLVLSFLSEKGGVGKTTSTVNTAAALKRNSFDVCVIDMDPQMSLSDTYQADTENSPSVFNVLMGTTEINEAIQKQPNGDIIPASPDLSSFALGAVEMPGSKKSHPYKLKKALEDLEFDYDVICIDSSPSLSLLSINGLAASTHVVIPAVPDEYSLRSVINTFDTINYVKEKINPDLEVEGILLTRYNPQSPLHREIRKELEEIAAENETKVFKREIRQCLGLSYALRDHTNIFAYKRGHAESARNGVTDYSHFVQELLGRE